MPSFKEHYPSQYLEKEDLKGKRVRGVIASADGEKVGDDHKIVLRFQGRDKGMVCNKTNAEIIAELYGEDTDDWIGKEIVIYVDPNVMYGGKRVGGLRVEAPPAKAAAPAGKPKGKLREEPRDGYVMTTMEPAPADPDDDIPF